MAGIFTAVNVLGSLFKAGQDSGWDVKNMPKEYLKNIKNPPIISADGSITKFLSSFIVEPVVILTKDVKKTEIADKLVILNTDIFSSFYMQAFYVLTNMYRLDATMAVKVLGTDNSSIFSTAGLKAAEWAANKLSKENRDYLGELGCANSKYLTISFEAPKLPPEDVMDAFIGPDRKPLEVLKYCNDEQLEYLAEGLKENIRKYNIKAGNSDYSDRDFKEVDRAIQSSSISNANKGNGLDKYSFELACNNFGLSAAGYTGKSAKDKEVDNKIKDIIRHLPKIDYKNSKVGELESENLYYIHHRDIRITLTATDEQTKVSRDIIIPITIKTHIIATTIDQILNMLKPNDRTKTFGYRLDEWRAGAISLKELIFCGDLIKSYKQNKLKDKDGLLNIIKQREESANAKALDTRMVGFEKYYNMLLVTADEKVLLNKHIGGDILNERYKQDLMNQAHALTLSVVDEDYERVYILTKDIRGRSDVTFKSIAKKSNKESDSAEIVKALMSNKPPVF